MKLPRFSIFLTLTVGLFAADVCAQDDATQVKTCFRQYQQALAGKNAAAALKLFSRNSFSYYDSVLHLARFADSQKLASQGLMCQLLVLTLRVRVPHSEIRVMSGTSLLEYAINSGMIGNVGQSGTELGAVRVIRDTAWAPLKVEGTETELMLRFLREHQWTLDLVHLITAGEQGMEQMLRQAEIERAAFIQLMLGRISEGKANAEVWQPVG